MKNFLKNRNSNKRPTVLNEGVLKLMEFAYNQTQKGNDFFFNYSGHVDVFEIYGYVGPWELTKDRIEKFEGSFKNFDTKRADEIIGIFIDKIGQDGK